ncbi:helix-turn-helix domain-containing protein [Clostridium sp. D33t1_170424_F3]|uniref:helix-turn-helix domain-containing protein n=1 Tax=Clostridium sp. D33t1_170424_F3 TaxID=2787099 RepID=UPI0018AB49E0|nr:helix-turn-helix domain-containing protein [Clostridium sp. D33t1_170424_F3]
MNEENQIGLRIMQRRKKLGMTQKQLADRLHVTDKAVSKWERGQGYPDIKTIPVLAKELGVSMNELLSGEPEEQPAPETERVVQNALEYADQVVKKKKRITAELVMTVMTSVFLLAMLVCGICDYALNANLTWSVFPISSIAFVWLVLAPLVWCKKNRVAKAMLSLTVWIVPFLWIIEVNSPVTGWLLPMGVPASVLGLAYLWALCWLFCYTKWNRWSCASIAMLLMPALDFGLDLVVARALGTPMEWVQNLLSVLVGLLVAAVLFSIGKRKTKEEPA